VAAIDCGTNSIRLLIAEIGTGGLVDVDRRMIAVRLGEGVDRTGHLAPDALERTFAACEQYRALIADARALRTRFVATSASRDADNAEEFTAGVRAILGVDPEVISGDEEAQLSFDGATRGVRHDGRVLVFDIGGGSTEFVLGERRAGAAISVDLGCVRFTERFAHHDPVTPQEHARIEAACEQLLDRVCATVPLADASTVIGLAGTVTTVAALALGLEEYDPERIHRSVISTEDVSAVARSLVAMTAGQRAALPIMHPGRADVVGVGAVILDRIMARTSVTELIASEHDILDGIAWSLAAARTSAD
jgi:exopolyphosphatase / guanosine-5'-triphosphate,3'-diphosphate pyrophosphatase